MNDFKMILRPLRNTLLLASLTLSAFVAAGCDDGEEQPATCADGLNNLYDIGCALFINGEQIDRSEAIQGCVDERSDADAKGCQSIRRDGLECLASADTCGECDYEMSAYNECMAG